MKEDSRGKAKILVAMGTACDRCYTLAIDRLGYTDFESYVDAKKHGRIPRQRLDEVAANMMKFGVGGVDKTFSPSTVAHVFGSTIEI